MAETTFDGTANQPFDYQKAVENGLKDIEISLKNIEKNQAETARLKAESREISKRLDILLQTF